MSTKISSLTSLLVAGVMSTTLASCAAPVLLGAVGAASYASLQERGAKQVLIDTKIKTHIKDRLTNTNYRYLSDIGIDVYNNNVLLTGIVKDRESGAEALNIVRGTPEIKGVYNELFVGAEYSTRQKAKDAWISAQIQPRLLMDQKTYPINYLTSVVNNHVYVIGEVSSEAEHQHLLHLLRTIKGVVAVHDYITVKPTIDKTISEDGSVQVFDYAPEFRRTAPSALPEDSFAD